MSTEPSPRWQQDPQAKALLAKCVETPPVLRYLKGTFGPNDGGLRLTGALVLQLRAIQLRYAEAALHEGDETGNFEQFRAECFPTVEEVIDGLLEEPEACGRIRRHVATGRATLEMGAAV